MPEKLSSELLRGSLDLMILSVLAEEPMYGYSIQKRLADASGQCGPIAGRHPLSASAQVGIRQTDPQPLGKNHGPPAKVVRTDRRRQPPLAPAIA